MPYEYLGEVVAVITAGVLGGIWKSERKREKNGCDNFEAKQYREICKPQLDDIKNNMKDRKRKIMVNFFINV